MIDGTYKTITTTDGVESPYITNTSFIMTYAYRVDDNYLTGFITYSDNTTYSKQLIKTILPEFEITISGVSKRQFSYTKFDGSQYDEIYNGVSYTVFPFIKNTYYNISYPATSYSVNDTSFKDDILYKCFASIAYSDDTSYTKTTQQPKIKIGDVKSITNVNVPQIKFTGLDGSDVVEIYQGVSKSLFPFVQQQTATSQTWSDSRVYTK